MSQIKKTCTNLTTLLHKIRDRKEANNGVVEDDMVADAMLLFAQLSGQHNKLMKEADEECEKILELRDSCEEQQEILEEQLTYMVYMDTEYDVRPWRPSEDGVVEVADTDNHTAIKTKLDTELVGRRKMCEYANTLEDEVTSLRKSEQEMRSELERVHKVMSSISTPAFLEGVKPCQTIPDTKLCGPLFTLHQMLTSSAREFPEVTVTVSEQDPLRNHASHYTGRDSLPDETWTLIEPDSQLLVLTVRGSYHLVMRYHPRINVVSCDDNFRDQLLGELCTGDLGNVEPHTSLSFTFTKPGFCDLISNKHIGRVYCWLHEMCGLSVITHKQRSPTNITAVQLLQYILSGC